MTIKPYFRLLLLASINLLVARAALADAPRITIDVNSERAHVEADYQLYGDTLSLFNVEGTAALPNGQATFIESLRVQDQNGHEIATEALTEGDWHAAQGNLPVHVSYDVRLQHDQYAWPAGAEEVSYRTKEGVFFVGATVFLVPAEKMDTDIQIRFKLPAGWQAHTPWLAQSDGSYIAKTRRDLLINALVVGTQHSEQMALPGLDLELVMDHEYVASLPLFTELLKPMLNRYSQLFGQLPERRKYLIVVSQGDTGDGGAFANSFSQFIQGPATKDNRVIWGYVMAHELLHFWNGLSLQAADEDLEWFKEGFTEYLTSVLLYCAGIFEKDYLLKRFETMYTRLAIARYYQHAEASLAQAGHNKQELRCIVYGGGALTALALEADMRVRTHGKIGVPDLLARMFHDYALNQHKYTQADIIATAKTLTGYDYSEWLAQRSSGLELLNMKAYLPRFGLDAQYFMEEAYIRQHPSPSAEQQHNFEAAFGRL